MVPLTEQWENHKTRFILEALSLNIDTKEKKKNGY
jgi:hypothetical protein